MFGNIQQSVQLHAARSRVRSCDRLPVLSIAFLSQSPVNEHQSGPWLISRHSHAKGQSRCVQVQTLGHIYSHAK